MPPEATLPPDPIELPPVVPPNVGHAACAYRTAAAEATAAARAPTRRTSQI